LFQPVGQVLRLTEKRKEKAFGETFGKPVEVFLNEMNIQFKNVPARR